LSEGGKADYLVTGDKSGLVALDRHKATRIVSAREFAALFVWSIHRWNSRKGMFMAME
jgi:predicted nucleic acid-binding protein